MNGVYMKNRGVVKFVVEIVKFVVKVVKFVVGKCLILQEYDGFFRKNIST